MVFFLSCGTRADAPDYDIFTDYGNCTNVYEAYYDLDSQHDLMKLNIVPYVVIDLLLDLVGFLLLGVVIHAVWNTRKLSPVFLYLTTVFCLTVAIQLVNDFLTNLLSIDEIIEYPTFVINSWQTQLSCLIAGLLFFEKFFLIMIQAIMAANRLCAVMFAANYTKIFVLSNTVKVVTVCFCICIPPVFIFLFHIGDTFAYYFAGHIAWYYEDTDLRIAMEYTLLFFSSIVLTAVIVIDSIVLDMLWRRRQNVLLAAVSVISVIALILMRCVDWNLLGHLYLHKLFNIVLAYIYL
ncbi:hypothetical protein Q1695_013026 [Nippostrongylus brasiliensis]|nr:hypothetical protein Q1695_013026 [Nippostrongylus brasiliensis]